jgi:3-isopropylmalate dehydrogenase
LAETAPKVPSLSERPPLIGLLEGAGIGPEVVRAAVQILRSVEQVTELEFDVRHGGPIGETAMSACGQWLPDTTAEFCADVFRSGGAILSGPGGGRYVYDLRRRFDLFCKFVPVQPAAELARAGRIAPRFLKDVDILIVRDNAGGIYQGRWRDGRTDRGRVAEHSFGYSEEEVRRLVEVAARAAAARKGVLHIVVKEGGLPTISALWREVGESAARASGIAPLFINIDLAAYELIQNAAKFDVIAAPNLFGDILADVAGVLVASRGVTYSGNFDAHGHGVYQTNHGCAHDLAGTGTANPAGQILSLAMLLRESFGLHEGAALIERSLAETWRAGWRTADVAEPGCPVLGTEAFAQKVAEEVLRSTEVPQLT